MEIKSEVAEFPSSSDLCESESLPQVLHNSLKCESEVNEKVDKKRQLKSDGCQESGKLSAFRDSLSVPDKKGICRSKTKFGYLPLSVCDKEGDTSSLEQFTSLPQNHYNSKIKMQLMKPLSPEQVANLSRMEHFKTCSSDQYEGLHMEHLKSSVSDQCTSKSRQCHVDSISCDKRTKMCNGEQFTVSSFHEKAACKSKMTVGQNSLLLVNDKQSPSLSTRIKADQFDTNDRYRNHNQLCPNIPQAEIEETASHNGAAVEDFSHLEYNKTTSNSSPAPHFSRLIDSSIIPIHLQSLCEHAVVNKSSLMLCNLGSAQKSSRSVPMREAVDPSKYSRVPDGEGFKFKCSNCGNMYKWRKSLNKHWKEKHDVPSFRSTAVTGIDRKLGFHVKANCSAEGSSLQNMTLISAEFTRSFPYSFYSYPSQMSIESSPSTSMLNLQLADPLNFQDSPSSALLCDLSENGSIRNLQMHDHLGRHMKSSCGTLCPSSRSQEQISTKDTLRKMPSSDNGTWNIPHMPQVTTRSDKMVAVCPKKSCSHDQLADCILDLSNKGRECVLAIPDLSYSVQEYPLDLSTKSSSLRCVLQKNVTTKTNHTATGPSNTGTTEPGMPVEGALCSSLSKTWPFCSRCSVRFSSVQELNLHFVRNHLEHPIEESNSAGSIDKNILPKIGNPICNQPATYQYLNAGNICYVCRISFLTRQKLAQHFGKDHRHIRPNPFQACLYDEDPLLKVPHVDKNFHKTSAGFYQQYDNRVVKSGCFTDGLNTTSNESDCFKSCSKKIVSLNIGLAANRTISSFSDPADTQTKEWIHELEASQDSIHNSDFNPKRRCASLSCNGLQDQTMLCSEGGSSSDVTNVWESSKILSHHAMHDVGALTSFTDLVTRDTVPNSETITLSKLGTQDIVPNAVNLPLSQQVTLNAKTNTIKSMLSSARGMKRGLGKTARNGRKDTGTGDKDLRHKCDFCEFRARWPSEMTQHKKNHSSDKPFKCNHCSYRSKWKWDVRKHLKRCGLEHQRLKKGADAVCEPEATDSSPIPMSSQRAAGVSANNSRVPDRHAKRSALKRSLHNLVQQEMGKTRGSLGVENHAWTLGRVAGAPAADAATRDKRHSCSHCEFIGQSPVELRHHARVHLHTKPYKCKMCGYATKRKSDLKKHMRTLSHELEGARRSVEVPCANGCLVLNSTVCPCPRNVESKEYSQNSGMVGEKFIDAKDSRCDFRRIVFRDGRLRCKFCNYICIEITLSHIHECLSKDRKLSTEGFGDNLTFWEHLRLQRKT